LLLMDELCKAIFGKISNGIGREFSKSYEISGQRYDACLRLRHAMADQASGYASG